MRGTAEHRQEVLQAMHKAAAFMVRTGWTQDEERAIWDMASQFNSELFDDERGLEIAVYETSDADDMINGFMIEDEPYYYDQMTEITGHKYTVYNEEGDWSYTTDSITEAKGQVNEFGGHIVVNVTGEEA